MLDKKKLKLAVSKKNLEALYVKYNRREFVHPDPLEFLYNHNDLCDREIVGLVASSLAYGHVKQILKSVSTVLEPMKPTPSAFLKRAGEKTLLRTYKNFKHRWSTGSEIAAMLSGAGRMIELYGSLQKCFLAGLNGADKTVLPALASFVNDLVGASNGNCSSLLPSPERGSACKRLNLFLRWMVRHDDVDPGGWSCVAPSKLIVPLDTHMYRTGKALGFTNRKQAKMKAALEITEAFREFSPDDPTKYDFALTRLGIRDDTDLSAFLKTCTKTL